MANLLLVHGAFHDARCWSRLTPYLERQGHYVCAVDLTGQGEGRRKNPFRITMIDYRNDVIEAAEHFGGQLTAIGHSLGGFIISAAAHERPNLFHRLVYIASPVPKGNCSALGTTRGGQGSSILKSFRLSVVSGSARFDRDKGIRYFYHDCSPADQEAASNFMVPQPLRPLLSRTAFTDDGLSSIPKYYIECLDDRAMALALQREMQSRYDFKRVLSIGSSHSPYWSQPKRLSRLIQECLN